MLTLHEMLLRFGIALVLGAVLGIEREIVGKGAGVRTEMLVAGGATLFTMIGLTLPYLLSAETNNLADVIARNSGPMQIIANIVVGIGFLGAGLIVKDGGHPHNLTTAALVWATAGIGILVGIGLCEFAAIVTVVLALLLFIIRKLNISQELEGHGETS